MSKRKRKKWVPPKPLWYKVDPTDERKLILKNGSRIKMAVEGVYTSEGGKVYTLTYRGLCPKTINYDKKLNYGKRTRSGKRQGQRYPYITFRKQKYEVHVLVALAWIGTRKEGEEIDHITGVTHDIRVCNLRIISLEENHWCAGILKRLRRLSKLYHLPMMHPARRTPEDMLALFERFKKLGLKKGLAVEIERQKVIHAGRSKITNN